MTAQPVTDVDVSRGTPATPVFFLSDSTGISAETMGNALLIQFPQLRFERRLIPFISTPEEARRVVEVLDRAAEGPVTPIAFTTAATMLLIRVIRLARGPGASYSAAWLTGPPPGASRSGPAGCPVARS